MVINSIQASKLVNTDRTLILDNFRLKEMCTEYIKKGKILRYYVMHGLKKSLIVHITFCKKYIARFTYFAARQQQSKAKKLKQFERHNKEPKCLRHLEIALLNSL